MKLHIRQLIRPLALLAFVATPALAGDFYVDAVHGNDGNGGSATMDAWRTLTYALDAIPATPLVPHTIHVAPGTHDAALGERFPLAMRPGLRLVGADRATTILEGPATSLLLFRSDVTGFFAPSGAEKLTMRHADQGVEFHATKGASSPSFSDLVIEDMQGTGIALHAASPYSLPPFSMSATVANVTISACYDGIDANIWSAVIGSSGSSVTLTDCFIHDCVRDGIGFSSGGLVPGSLSMTRTQVVHNGGNGVFMGTSAVMGEPSLGCTNSLFAHNGDAGIRVNAGLYWLQQPYWPTTKADLRHCTIANNDVNGIAVAKIPTWVSGYPLLSHFGMSLSNSVVWGNGDDFWVDRVEPDEVDGFSTNCGDGYLLGDPGCIAADAAFVDPSNDDFRLAFGSPCVDSADPAFASTTDLFGRARSLDGDLDTIALPDMGAIEFAPLAVASHEPGSTRIVLELWGPDYGRSILYLSDTPVLTTPEATPFGSFYLVRSTAVVIPMARIQSRTSNLLELKIPALAVPGSTVSLQALIRSQSAPAGAAWSNPLELVVAP